MKTETKQEHWNYRKKHGLRKVSLTISPSYLAIIKATLKATIDQDNSIDKQVKQYLKQQLKELK